MARLSFYNLCSSTHWSISCGKKPMVMCMWPFLYPNTRWGNLTQQPLTEIVLSSKQQQFGLEKSQKLTALCRHCEFRKLCYGGCPKHRFCFSRKMNPIHIIIYVPLTVISLNKRHSICKPWLVKFGYIHPPLKVEWCFLLYVLIDMNPWILLAISICLEIVATNLLKVSDGFTQTFTHRWFISAICHFVYFCLHCFRTLSVGLVYAIWSGVGIVDGPLWRISLFGQKIDTAGLIGMALIISGVLVINLFSQTGH